MPFPGIVRCKTLRLFFGSKAFVQRKTPLLSSFLRLRNQSDGTCPQRHIQQKSRPMEKKDESTQPQQARASRLKRTWPLGGPRTVMASNRKEKTPGDSLPGDCAGMDTGIRDGASASKRSIFA
jgi:hypothetical protein